MLILLTSAALIATSLSAGALDGDVSLRSGAAPTVRWEAGVSAQTFIPSVQDGTTSNQVFFSGLGWFSVRGGAVFGERFTHGPELEAGFQRYRMRDPDTQASPGSLVQGAHFGLGYHLAIDLFRGRALSLWMGARLVLGVISDPAPIDGFLGLLYGQVEATVVGAGFRAGGVEVRLGVGPLVGIYAWYPFTMLHAGASITF